MAVPEEAEEAEVYYDPATQRIELAILTRKPTLRWYHNPLLMLFLGGVLGVVVHAWLTGTLFA